MMEMKYSKENKIIALTYILIFLLFIISVYSVEYLPSGESGSSETEKAKDLGIPEDAYKHYTQEVGIEFQGGTKADIKVDPNVKTKNRDLLQPVCENFHLSRDRLPLVFCMQEIHEAVPYCKN